MNKQQLEAARALVLLARSGKAHQIIEDYKVNTTDGPRAGQRYQTVLTDGGNVLHRYTNGDVVFVRKQPRPSQSLPIGTSFDMDGSGVSYRMPDPVGPPRPKVHPGEPPVVTTESDAHGNEITDVTPAQQFHTAQDRLSAMNRLQTLANAVGGHQRGNDFTASLEALLRASRRNKRSKRPPIITEIS